MKKIVATALSVIAFAALITALSGTATAEDTESISDPVSVAVIFDAEGEVAEVQLTDSKGKELIVGSIAEDREAMYPEEFANTDAEG